MSRGVLRCMVEGQTFNGVALSRDEAVALNGTKLVTATPEGEGWRVAAGQWIGAVRCGDLDVRVAPKVGAIKVLELLARAMGVRGLRVDPTQISFSDDTDLSAVLAVLFEREARLALALGPQRGYRSEEQSLPVVRGRIRLVDQALRRYGMVTPIEVIVDEWTFDTDDNRRLLAATQLLLDLPGIPPSTIHGLRHVERTFVGVNLPASGAVLAQWRATRLNAHLHKLLGLSDLALGGSSVEYRVGNVVASGFALNMSWVFEVLVARLLSELCMTHGATHLILQESVQLDKGNRLTIRPDLILAHGSDVVAVADTKYKVLNDSGAFPNADAYQLITYCLRFGLSTGHLIYAGKGGELPGQYLVQGAEVEIMVHAIDLAVDLGGIEAQIRAIYDRLTQSAESSRA